jgi:hypothetical protein
VFDGLEKCGVGREKRQVSLLTCAGACFLQQRLLPLHSCLTGSDLTAKLCNYDARAAMARTNKRRSRGSYGNRVETIAGQSRDRVRVRVRVRRFGMRRSL